MKKIIILMGIPASGKGTQARLLVDHLGYGHISTGDLLRALAQDEHADPEDKQMLDDMKAGKLVADTLIYKLAFAEIKKNLDAGNGVVLDGAIRSVDQAKAYQEFFENEGVADEVAVIEIAVRDEVGLERIALRKKYAEEGKLVPSIAASRRATETGAAPEVVRKDDDAAVMKKRMQEQGNTVIQPILSYYDELGVLIRVDGERSIDDVDTDVINVLSA